MKFYALNQNYGDLHLSPIDVISDELVDKVKLYVENGVNYETIKDKVRVALMGQYWSRCEYEFVASNWAGNKFEQKVDVYMQLEPNLDAIVQLLLLQAKCIYHDGKLLKFKYKDLTNARANRTNKDN